MSDRSFLNPDTVATNFHLRPGDKVADFGSGLGNFLPTLSRLVGGEGRVYACEIQHNLIDSLHSKVREEKLNNVEIVWADLEAEKGSKIESGALDAVLVTNVLFQAEDRSSFMKEVARVLRAGGKLVLVDWSESWGGMGPQPAGVLKESEARALAESSGLTFERSFDAGAHHYGLAFRKA